MSRADHTQTPNVRRIGQRQSTAVGSSIILIGIGVHVLLFLFVRVDLPTNSLPEEDTAFVRFVATDGSDADQLMIEQAQLFDSAPLFMPSRWNHGRGSPVEAPDRPLFTPFAEQTGLNADSITAFATELAEDLDLSMGTILAGQNWSVFSSLGRGFIDDPDERAHRGLITFALLDVNQVIRRIPFPDDLRNRVDENGLWNPAAFMLHIDAGREVGIPLALESSGLEELDAAFVDVLRGPFFVSGLPSGYYRVVFSP